MKLVARFPSSTMCCQCYTTVFPGTEAHKWSETRIRLKINIAKWSTYVGCVIWLLYITYWKMNMSLMSLDTRIASNRNYFPYIPSYEIGIALGSHWPSSRHWPNQCDFGSGKTIATGFTVSESVSTVASTMLTCSIKVRTPNLMCWFPNLNITIASLYRLGFKDCHSKRKLCCGTQGRWSRS